jgi:hypothetical protein
VSKLKSQAGEVLKVLHRLKARPGDCVQFVTLVRNGMAEHDVVQGVRECARLGHVLERSSCAELTEAGHRAIDWGGSARRKLRGRASP